MNAINDLKLFYENELKNDVLPFWLKNAVDYEYGGYFTSLDRKGEVYNYDKSVWFQGRMLYILSKLLNTYGENEEIRKAADCGYDFIKKCYFEDGRMPFIVNRQGVYIQKRRYFFSETFAAIALAEYYKATGNIEALNLSRKTYQTAISVMKGDIKTEPKFNPDIIKAKAFAVPMIMLNTASILREHDVEFKEKYNSDIDYYLKEIKDFYHPEFKCCFENVGLNGEVLEGPRGRLVNPGHSIEAGWFMLNEAEIRNDKELMDIALNIIDWSFDLGWDKENGGITYFVDIMGKPLEQLEWDMRLWWPHNEALIAFIKAYRMTGDKKYFDKFMMVHDYSFSHFKDNEYGEWYGYLRRDGSVNNTLKGSLFKGPFHIPRCLILVAKELSLLGDK